MNAQAEKIQYVLGTLPGLSPAATISNVLAVNESVHCVLQTAMQKQMYLQNKLKQVLQAPSLTEPTGPAVPLVTSNVAHMISNILQNLGDNNGVPLLDNIFISGTAITHTPGSAQINLAPNQIYYATYEVQATIPSDGFVQVQFELNGSLVGGTQSRATETPGDNVPLTSSAIINTGAGSSVLELVNTSGQAIDLTGTNVNIIKLA
ncbi:collagen-like protein [Bacillus fungorum]|uniref:collagen-like protein n=1 Tax=Bacillus fungorum TaxID=2039284 RepID=UPI003394B6BC